MLENFCSRISPCEREEGEGDRPCFRGGGSGELLFPELGEYEEITNNRSTEGREHGGSTERRENRGEGAQRRGSTESLPGIVRIP